MTSQYITSWWRHCFQFSITGSLDNWSTVFKLVIDVWQLNLCHVVWRWTTFGICHSVHDCSLHSCMVIFWSTHTHTFHCLPICARPVQYCQYVVSGVTKLLMLSNSQKKLMIQLSWICIDVQSGQLIMHRVYWTTLDYYIQTDHEHLLVSEHQ